MTFLEFLSLGFKIADWPKVNSLGVVNASTLTQACAIAKVAKEGKTALVLVEDESVGAKLVRDINEIMGIEIAVLFPSRDFNFLPILAQNNEYEITRIAVLNKLKNGDCKAVIATPEATQQFVMPKKVLTENSFCLRKNDEISILQLTQRLCKLGYLACEFVEVPGQFAVRGGIVDIYSPSEKKPVRIEFFGDRIENIFELNVLTNRREATKEKLEVLPVKEAIYAPEKLLESLKEVNERQPILGLSEDIKRLESGLEFSLSDRYFNMIYDKKETLLGYMGEVCELFICESNKVAEKAEQAELEEKNLLADLKAEGILRLQAEIGIGWRNLTEKLTSSNWHKTVFEHFDEESSLVKTDAKKHQKSVNLSPIRVNFAQILKEIEVFLKENFSCAICTRNKKNAEALANFLKSKGIKVGLASAAGELPSDLDVWVLSNGLSCGVRDDYGKIAVLTYPQNFENGALFKETGRLKKIAPLQSLVDLNVGNYVVHTNHGIGMFAGIEQIEIDSVKKDFIKIEYEGTDILFLPATQLDMLAKYLGSSKNIKKNRLNGKGWQQTRFKAKKEVSKLARELALLYAKRMNVAGFAFSADGEWQNEFEQSFGYEETPDQLRCIAEVKKDMEAPRPMDRILCGDVGVGKTEIAFRAAFKCVMDSKQVAIIVPTTILAWQHYNTALDRFSQFPISIALLSRFKTPKEQKEILKKLKNGEVDIVIGTHRLFQKDVEFADVGLMIIDEEQRFGVRHKEHIKELKKNVDCLSISATPIPRTLNMAMMGIKDISVIDTPPLNRLLVQTQVLEYDELAIKEAIKNELRRGGQVFYVHNRVDSIYETAQKLQNLMGSGARIIVAHGQMSHGEITNSWNLLLAGKADILVCTTIIETGVDIPNCNTLIIEDAQNLGLSQLHQLRGRVGRSSRRSYAYFLFKKDRVLSEVAQKRLDTIKEFAQFGAGFKIAMRDLEIRGAGNILGDVQHGKIDLVGYDMYMKLLNEALMFESGEEVESFEDCSVDIDVTAFIPDEYVKNISTKLSIYKKIAAIKSVAEADELREDLRDVYGRLPSSVENLLSVVLVRRMASGLGIVEIKQRGNKIDLLCSEFTDGELELLLKSIKGITLEQSRSGRKLVIKLENKKDNLKELKRVLNVWKALKLNFV
ncbi:MAG: transcription-repair coupling factor [Oscillospiraceae bacterium]